MSVRSEPKEMSPGMQQALMIPQDVMRTAAQQAEGPLMAPAPAGQEMIAAAPNDQHLAQANEFNTSNPNHPLKRTVVINIRSSLADLCLKKSRATWSPPSADATKAIFQQRKCKRYALLELHSSILVCYLNPHTLFVQSRTFRVPRRRREI